MKKKTETKSTGALKDEDFVPWNGITLNRCLAVAAIAALLSVGFQILQETPDTDDFEEAENEVWTPELIDNSSEPWFFEAWFGSSTTDSAIVEEPEETDAADTAEPDIYVAEEQDELEESEAPAVEEEIETEEESKNQEPIEQKKREESKEKQKTEEQWGLKSKSRYMEAKGVKIRIATEGGGRKEAFPFNLAKKPKDSPKPYSGEKEKPSKNGKYQKKHEENKYDHPKKQDYDKSFKKESKYSKQDRGKKEEKDYKAYKEYHHEKDYKKKYDPRHHG